MPLPKEAFIQPLDRSFYVKLISLETKLTNQSFTQTDVSSLSELYAKCVEYFDSCDDDVKFYFIEKIQMAIAQAKSILTKMKQTKLQNLNSIQQNKTSPKKEAISPSSSELKKQHCKKLERGLSISRIKKQRLKRMSLQIQLHQATDEINTDTQHLVKKYEEGININDGLIKNELKEQVQNMEKRLEQRKDNLQTNTKFHTRRVSNNLPNLNT